MFLETNGVVEVYILEVHWCACVHKENIIQNNILRIRKHTPQRVVIVIFCDFL